MALTKAIMRGWTVTLALPIALAAAQASYSQDRVIITPSKVVLIRTGKMSRSFPERRRAVVRYPLVSGLRNAAVLKKVRRALSLKSVFDSTLAEYRRDGWLLELDYKVDYNKNYLLDITFTQSGMGAYPDTQDKHLLINLKTGDMLKFADAFDPSSASTVAAKVDQKLQAEIAENIKDVTVDSYASPDEKDAMKDALTQLKFGSENLDEFAVSDTGVTFLYDAGFPHVIRAIQPDGKNFFSYGELRPHIKPDGPLGNLSRAKN